MHPNWPEPSEFPTLSGDAVHIWAVPLDDSAASSTQIVRVLSADERARADGFALDKPRQVFAASRAALRTLLGRYLDLPPSVVPIAIDPNGKPRVADGDLRFNLAHSGDVTLVAVTRGCEIGVDVELLRSIDYAREIAARSFHPAELAAIRAASAAQLPALFMRLWTRKEAVLKAVGAGLGYPLDAFDVRGDDWVTLPACASLPDTCCWLQDMLPCRDYLAAVATLEFRQPPQGFTYSL